MLPFSRLKLAQVHTLSFCALINQQCFRNFGPDSSLIFFGSITNLSRNSFFKFRNCKLNMKVDDILTKFHLGIPESRCPRSFEITFVLPFRCKGFGRCGLGTSQLQRFFGANSRSNYLGNDKKYLAELKMYCKPIQVNCIA